MQQQPGPDKPVLEEKWVSISGARAASWRQGKAARPNAGGHVPLPQQGHRAHGSKCSIEGCFCFVSQSPFFS